MQSDSHFELAGRFLASAVRLMPSHPEVPHGAIGSCTASPLHPEPNLQAAFRLANFLSLKMRPHLALAHYTRVRALGRSAHRRSPAQ